MYETDRDPMPKEVPLCKGEINEERFMDVKHFLEAYSLNEREALVLYEVVYSGDRFYVGVDLVARKLTAHRFSESEVEKIFKTLFKPEKGHLKPYKSKKEVLCSRPDDYGLDAARVMRNNCYTTILPLYAELEKEYNEKAKRRFSNPAGWYPPRRVESWDSNGESISIDILDLKASDEISHTVKDEIIYGTIVSLEIKCKICGTINPIKIEFTNQTFWGFEFQINCTGCPGRYQITKDLRTYKLR